ncbi:RNA-dependent RNA polymerase [Erysiphe necator associated mitovirus 13]|nr:RNA-dependent RNA polymerase [Erysiphe necator associated mitovirus 13]
MNKEFQIKTNPNLSKRLDSVGYIRKDMFLSWIRLIVWSLQVAKSPYMILGTRILNIWRINGPTFVVQYTKECTRILQAFISGHPVFITNLPIALSGGLPSIIPGFLRSLLRDGDLSTRRAVLSVFAVYRIILIPGKLKLNTITDPFKGLSSILPKYEIRLALRELLGDNLHLKLQPIKLEFLGTAGPNHPISMFGIWKDLLAWKDDSLFPELRTYCSKVPGGKEFLDLIDQEIDFIDSNKEYISLDKKLILGKLSEKKEAAGKVRIFAITDSITQSVFKPLSDGIFRVLKNLPMDGTFDQDKPVRYLVDLWKQDQLVGETFYSYDLSAATDRLPIPLQQQVLSLLVGEKVSRSWVEILTSREWFYKDIPYKYSVGQPMGALSSWAMLALTHHILVRISALRVGKLDFSHYAILGDDVVIANKAVAESYHYIMTVILGVEINLSKSLISEDSFEFAKRIVTMKGEVSPVGSKNLLIGLKSLKGIPSILQDLVNKGYYLSEESVNQLYKSIPTVRKSQLERLSWLVKGPFGFIPTADGLSTSIKLTNSLSAVSMDRFLSSIDDAKHILNLKTWERNLSITNDVIRQLLGLKEIPGFKGLNPLDSPIYNHILDRYWSSYGDIISKKPVRRFIFDGPLVFVNYYRQSWKFEMMDYIKSKVKDTSNETISLLDPFKDDKVILPLSHSAKSENFWLLVKEIEDRKTSDLGFRGLV